MNPDGKFLNPRAFNNVLLDPAILAILPPNLADMRVGEFLSKVSSGPMKVLINGLGLRQDQLAVLLIWSYEHLGGDDFQALYGNSVNMVAVERVADAMKVKGISQDSPLKDVANYAQGKK